MRHLRKILERAGWPAGQPPRRRRSLSYGRTGSGTGATGRLLAMNNPPGAQKYLAFETDFGGWNNILMQFEIMVVLAWITERILVLPPATPFYLLGEAPRLLDDFLDLSELRRRLPVLTAEEFARRAGRPVNLASHEAYHAFMRASGHTPRWDGIKSMLIFPPDALHSRPELLRRLPGRRLVGLFDEVETCELLYFPMDEQQRMFGVAESFFLFGDEMLERQARGLLRDTVRYRADIVDLAERALDAPVLADRPFSSLHVRRGDFQYGETRIGADDIARHTAALLTPGQTIYVATDETDGAFMDAFRDRFDVVTFDCLPRRIVRATPDHWRGIVETLICACAPGRFIGTRLSTFSARIATLRGHLSQTRNGDFEGIDTALYYTQPPLYATVPEQTAPYATPRGKHMDALGETGEPWWLSIDKVPIWGRAYRAVWAETDDPDGPLSATA